MYGKINILCDTALLIGYTQGTKLIDARMVDEARENLGWGPFSGTVESESEDLEDGAAFIPKKTSHRSSLTWAAGIAASACLILAAALNWVTPTKSKQEFATVSGHVRFRIPTVLASGAASRVSGVIPTIPARPKDQTGLLGLSERREDSGSFTGRQKDFESREPGPVQTQTRRGEGETLQERDRKDSPDKKDPKDYGQSVPVQRKKLAGRISGGQDRTHAKRAEPEKATGLVIQIAAYRQKSAALQTIARLREIGHDAYLEQREFMDQSLFYRVRLGGFANSEEATATKGELNKLGFVRCYIAKAKKG